MVMGKSNTYTLIPSKSNSREHGPKSLDSGAAKENHLLIEVKTSVGFIFAGVLS